MKQMLKNRNNRKGRTLIDVIVAGFIMVVTVAALISIVAFSNTLTGKNITNESAYTEAEGIADLLMSAISKGTTDAIQLSTISGADYVSSTGSFSSTPGAKEFTFTEYNEGDITGYKIYVRTNNEKGDVRAYITAFASSTGGVLS